MRPSVTTAGRSGVLRVGADREWLQAARRIESPNFDARPDPSDISLLVIHAISLPPERFSGDAVERLFTNRLDPTAHPYFAGLAGVRVSAHLFIRRRGELIQFVPFTARAWHAGASSWQGRERCNDFSIGIELEGSDHRPFTAAQMRRLRQVVAALRLAFPAITQERVVGHSDIAPGRKSDPGPFFDWDALWGS
jgi:N-acetyl-anhydromuramoyl-L-alanine amidase